MTVRYRFELTRIVRIADSADVTVRSMPRSAAVDDVPADTGAAGDAVPPAAGRPTSASTSSRSSATSHEDDRRRPRCDAAWQRVADRHAILRTRFRWVDRDEPVQEVVDARRRAARRPRPRRASTADRAGRRAGRVPRRRPPCAASTSTQAPLWRVDAVPARPGAPALRVHVPPLAARHERGLGGRGGRSAPTTRRGAARSPSSSERRPYKDHIAVAARAPRRRSAGGPGVLRASCSTASTSRPGSTRWSAPAPPTRTATSGTARCGSASPTDVSAAAPRVRRRASGVSGAGRSSRRRGRLVLAAFSGIDRRRVRLDPRLPALGPARAATTSMGLFINTPPVRVTIDPTRAGASSCSRRCASSRSTSAPTSTPRCPTSRRSMDTRGAPLFDTIVVVNELHQGTRLKALGGPFERRDFDLHDQTNFPLTLLAYIDPAGPLQAVLRPPSLRRRRRSSACASCSSTCSTAIVDRPDGPVADAAAGAGRPSRA